MPHRTSDNGYVRVTVKYHPFVSGGEEFLVADVKLLDFDVDGARLKINHELFIAHYAYILSEIAGSQFFVLGSASRSTRRGNNQTLTKWRTDAVLKALWDYGADPKKIALEDALGNFAAAKTANYHDRAVAILVTCPPSSRAQLEKFESSWKADPWRPRSQEPLE
jgi:hypothetical protein